MQVSSGFAHMLTSNQRGRGHDPVTVLGSIKSLVTVNATGRSFGAAAYHRIPRPAICRPLEAAKL
jgi:hypothetical protein